MLRNQVINVNDDVNVDDNCLPDGLRLQVALLGANKPAAVATVAKPRAEISLLNLCRGAKEGNFKLTDALFASASSLEKELTLEEKSTLKEFQDSG